MGRSSLSFESPLSPPASSPLHRSFPFSSSLEITRPWRSFPSPLSLFLSSRVGISMHTCENRPRARACTISQCFIPERYSHTYARALTRPPLIPGYCPAGPDWPPDRYIPRERELCHRRRSVRGEGEGAHIRGERARESVPLRGVELEGG